MLTAGTLFDETMIGSPHSSHLLSIAEDADGCVCLNGECLCVFGKASNRRGEREKEREGRERGEEELKVKEGGREKRGFMWAIG